MNKQFSSSNPDFRLFPVFLFMLSTLLFTSCKDNSTSNKEPEDFENCGDLLTDIDGNSYRTTQIGSQCWTAQDLSTTSYRDGTSLPNVTEDSEWDGLTTGAWAYFNNDDRNYYNSDKKGKLYNWFAVNDSRGICPAGWKVPSDNDWKTFEIALGMTQEEADMEQWRGGDANIAGKMKDPNSWSRENITNESGFSAIPTGIRSKNGAFDQSYSAVWWTSSELNESEAWERWLLPDYTEIYRNVSPQTFGFSIRCVMN